ncbi:MAG: hypothetical protein AB1384_05960 [Actinomycetota bacterium]
MRSERRSMARGFKLLSMLLLAAIVTLAAASCGGSSGSSRTSETATKLPPGATTTESTLTTTSDATGAAQAQATGEDEEEESGSVGADANAASSGELTKTAYLSGANFSVVSVTREDSNETVAGSGVREVAGDFLQIEMAVENAGGELVDLSSFSFRLWNPAIEAGLYDDFYGSTGTYGSYVSENMISAALLDYENLQSVSMKLRVGETVDNIFLFFDLNPQSTAVNEGVSLAGTNLVIYDTETGDQVEINLADYAG